jgi:hypothetical protein
MKTLADVVTHFGYSVEARDLNSYGIPVNLEEVARTLVGILTE